MAKTGAKAVAAATVLAALIEAGSSFADPATDSTVALHVTDYARVPRGSLAEAQKNASGVTDQGQLATAPTISIWVRNDEQAPLEVLTRAKAEVAHIYRAAGVNIVWRRPSASFDAPGHQASWFVIDIVSPKRAERLPFAPNCHALGAATGDASERGHVGYVRYRCIEPLAQQGGLNRAHALGVVMAHELGHLLLPYHAHSTTGLMKADWSRADLYLAQHGSLLFTPEQAELIRNRLTGHAGNEAASDLDDAAVRTENGSFQQSVLVRPLSELMTHDPGLRRTATHSAL